MSSRTYHRTRTPGGTAVTVRDDRGSYLLAVGRGERLSCGTDAATALVAVLADRLGLTVDGLPEWAANAEIEASDK